MPIEESQILLEVPVLQALPLDPEQPTDCYPLPRLETTGQNQMLHLDTLRMSNAFWQVDVVPELGGRILSIQHVPTGQFVVAPPKQLAIAQGGTRGLWTPSGIQPFFDTFPGMVSMAPAEVSVREEAEGPTVLIFQLAPGSQLAAHFSIHLPDNSPWLEISCAIVNRGMVSQSGRSGIGFGHGLGARQLCGNVWWIGTGEETGIAVVSDSDSFEDVCPIPAACVADYISGSPNLFPRHSQNWTVRLVPTVKIAPTGGSSSALLEVGDGHARVWALSPIADAELFIETEKMGTLKAAVSAAKGALWSSEIPAQAGKIIQSGLRGSEGDWIVQEAAEIPAHPTPLGPMQSAREHLLRSEFPLDWAFAGKELGLRAAALVRRASEACSRRDWESARSALHLAAETNAEDPLLWWHLAAIARHEGIDNADFLTNAHYLAPLDPLLRAEAFLAQSPEMSADPVEFVAPVANDPELAREVADNLICAGLVEDAVRWMDECLRHRTHPMLHYLLAWLHHSTTQMEFEAANHVKKASESPVELAVPWRRIERQAIADLQKRYPQDQRLGELANFARVNP
ncbi:MAG: DUF5107 domain-containing protein [Armatimonadetes bacterium]|nr:DUF5107 domain-containing protein [Armatimonadota bacterium]